MIKFFPLLKQQLLTAACIIFISVSGFSSTNKSEYNRLKKINNVNSVSGDSIVVAAGKQYKASKFKQKIAGVHYREEWTTPVKMPVLDFKTVAGGLKPVEKGGGNQTISIKLVSKDSIEYALRQIDKDPSRLVPEGLRGTFIDDFVQDQMSSGHPYGHMIVPSLSEAAGIFYNKAQLFYVPASPILGDSLSMMFDKPAFLEIRPDGDLSKFKQYGYTKNAISTKKMFEKVREDSKHSIDERMYLRSRLFDMIIGDWDRHQDQWRWGEFPSGDKTIYKPIPRDRDQAFVKYDGFIPSQIAGKKGKAKALSSFTEEITNVKNLNLSGSIMDRMILNEMKAEDWKLIADSLKKSLTDQVIENSVRKLPPPIFAISGEEIIRKLKLRRDLISDVALEYYKAVFRTVEITATDTNDFILVERLSDAEMKVTLSNNVKGKEKYFQRTFNPEETEEVRIYAFGGNDSVVVTGKVDEGIRVRIIGGEGKDMFADNSSVSGWKNHTVIYDERKGKNQFFTGRETKRVLKKNKIANEYATPKTIFYNYNTFGPTLSLEFNQDDKLFIGAGLVRKTFGFRKEPVKTLQKLVGNYATATGGYNIRYKGDFYSLFSKRTDLSVNVNYSNFLFNYFGSGNETQFIKGINYYRTRLSKLEVAPYVNFNLTKDIKFGVAPSYELYEVANNPGFVNEALLSTPEVLRDNSYFGGGRFFANIVNVDDIKDPKKGFKWENEVKYNREINGSTEHTNVGSELSCYLTLKLPIKVTLALRAGGSSIFGSYKFFQSNVLGQKMFLRGHRNNRFAGRSSAYQNTELRFRMPDFKSYVINGNWGLIAFLDQGRVWADGENSDLIHYGYGPGLWINFYKLFMVSAAYGMSNEDKNLRVQLGFYF